MAVVTTIDLEELPVLDWIWQRPDDWVERHAQRQAVSRGGTTLQT